MDDPKIVLGLKAEKRPYPFNDDDSDDGNFFSTSSSDGPNLMFAKPTQVYSITPPELKQKINAFSDASSRITQITNALKNSTYPQHYEGDIYLVPEGVLSENDLLKITNFIENKSETLDISNDNIDDVFAAQFEILKFYRKQKCELFQYTSKKIDSRVLSLLHFCIAKQTTDRHVSLYHLLSTLEETLKAPNFAPISALFPDFNISSLLQEIANDLVELFPKHPILPSVLHNLAEYNPDITQLVEKVENDISNQHSTPLADDTDDSDDDSFFEFLRQNKSKNNTVPQIKMLIEDNKTNPLDFSATQNKTETITVSVTEPPVTMTYYLDKEETKVSFTAKLFPVWIMSLRNCFALCEVPMDKWRMSIKFPDNPQSNQYLSAPANLSIENVGPNGKPSNETPVSINVTDVNYYLELYRSLSNQQKLLRLLPQEVSTDYFHLYYPVLQFINSSITSTCLKRGCPYPKLIALEHSCHLALQGVNPDILTPLHDLLSLVSDPIGRKPIVPLAKRRPFPELDAPYTGYCIPALAACDIELVLNGRSPLTCARISGPPPVMTIDHPIFLRANRASYLYEVYSTQDLPPYYAFRVGFAAALALIDNDPYQACGIMFELVYLLHDKLPLLSRSPFVRNCVLFFAETLERSDRYYYASLVFDDYFLSNITDTQNAANAIAQIAQRNGDTIRAAFFYTESIKSVIKNRKVDEALYLGQIIAQIYLDNGLPHLALSVLSYLLKDTYKIQVCQPKKLPNGPSPQQIYRRGTLRVTRMQSTTFQVEFMPNAKSINTMLVCCSYIDILIRNRMYKQAADTLQKLEDSMETPLLQSTTNYLKALMLVKSNRYDEAIAVLPDFELGNPKRTVTHISLLTGTSFDPSTAILKMMAKSTLDKLMFKESFVWSELIIHSKATLKEVGLGFLWRGEALMQCLANFHCYADTVDIKTDLLPIQKKFLHYSDKLGTFNERDIKCEAISSISVARFCFEKIGAIKKETEAALKYADIILAHFFDPSDPDQECGTLAVVQPRLYTVLNVPKRKEQVRVPEHVVTREGAADEISRILNFAERNASRLMSPSLIVYAQALQSKVALMKKNKTLAQTYYDFVYSTIQKYSCGPHFALRSVSNQILRSFQRTLTVAADLLIGFDTEFINNHLLIFDILSDLKSFLFSRMRNASISAHKAVISELDMDAEVLSLKNPKFPSFEPVLEESGYISKKDEIEPMMYLSFEAIFKLISANIRSFETGKLAEDTMHMRNKQYCHQLEKLSGRIQSEYNSQMLIDSNFSTAQRHTPAAQRTVFIQRIQHGILVYVPNTGQRNIVRFKSMKELQPESIDFKAMDREMSLTVRNGTFPASLYRTLLGFILVDKKGTANQFVNPLHSKQLLDAVKEVLFGNLLATCQLFMQKVPIIKDKIVKEDKKLFANKKGRLFTLDPCIEKSINFVVSCDLQAIPLEMMFRESLVLRLPNFFSLTERKQERAKYTTKSLKTILLRRDIESAELRWSGIERSVSLMEATINVFGGCERHKPYVNQFERTLPYPFPLFSSNKSNEHYQSRYKFCMIQDIEPGKAPIMPNMTCGRTSIDPLSFGEQVQVSQKYDFPFLYVFTYSDLVEFPPFLEQLFRLTPQSYFMFIPAFAVRHCFELIDEMFHRQAKRELSNKESHMKLVSDPVKFVAAVQITLIRTLDIPVSLFIPLNNQ